MSPILEYKDSDQINHIYTQRRNQDNKTDKKKKQSQNCNILIKIQTLRDREDGIHTQKWKQATT
jgi:hypothetical protein